MASAVPSHSLCFQHRVIHINICYAYSTPENHVIGPASGIHTEGNTDELMSSGTEVVSSPSARCLRRQVHRICFDLAVGNLKPLATGACKSRSG